MIYFDSSILHSLWSLVESHSHFLSTLSDEAITLWLIKSIEDKLGIANEDAQELQDYVTKRTCLIRDIVGTPEPYCDSSVGLHSSTRRTDAEQASYGSSPKTLIGSVN